MYTHPPNPCNSSRLLKNYNIARLSDTYSARTGPHVQGGPKTAQKIYGCPPPLFFRALLRRARKSGGSVPIFFLCWPSLLFAVAVRAPWPARQQTPFARSHRQVDCQVSHLVLSLVLLFDVRSLSLPVGGPSCIRYMCTHGRPMI